MIYWLLYLLREYLYKKFENKILIMVDKMILIREMMCRMPYSILVPIFEELSLIELMRFDFVIRDGKVKDIFHYLLREYLYKKIGVMYDIVKNNKAYNSICVWTNCRVLNKLFNFELAQWSHSEIVSHEGVRVRKIKYTYSITFDLFFDDHLPILVIYEIPVDIIGENLIFANKELNLKDFFNDLNNALKTPSISRLSFPTLNNKRHIKFQANNEKIFLKQIHSLTKLTNDFTKIHQQLTSLKF